MPTSALSLRLGSIPLRILPSFFVTTVVLNYGLARDEPLRLVVWTGIVLASVLVHELGHAVAGLAFGLAPRIELHGFGGTTSWSAGSRVSPRRRIVISLAGPCTGLAAGALVVAFAAMFGPGADAARGMVLAAIGVAPSPLDGSMASFAYESLLFVNVGWGLLNLLPMLPLDGGNVMAELFDLRLHGRGERPARIVSLSIAGAAALGALVTGRFWPAILAASFVALNWRGLQELRAREHDARAAASPPGST
ncbi:MAG TPA: site-2 protease family protein [Polyangiaceae bacterium]|jgi:Zn-dependent protease